MALAYIEKSKELEKIEHEFKELKQRLYEAETKYIFTYLTFHAWRVDDNNKDDVVKSIMKMRNIVKEFNPGEISDEINKIRGFISEIVKHGYGTYTATVIPNIKTYEKTETRRGRGRRKQEEECGVGGCL